MDNPYPSIIGFRSETTVQVGNAFSDVQFGVAILSTGSHWFHAGSGERTSLKTLDDVGVFDGFHKVLSALSGLQLSYKDKATISCSPGRDERLCRGTVPTRLSHVILLSCPFDTSLLSPATTRSKKSS